MTETRDAQLKRMSMRSWRRGTKEMDMILGPYSDASLANMNDAQLQQYDKLLQENDQDLYQWVSGQAEAPAHIRESIEDVRDFLKNRT